MGLLAIISARQALKSGISLSKTKTLQINTIKQEKELNQNSDDNELKTLNKDILNALRNKETKLAFSVAANSTITLGCLLQFTESTQTLLGVANTPFISDIGFGLYVIGILMTLGLSIAIYRNQQTYNNDLKLLEKEDQIHRLTHSESTKETDSVSISILSETPIEIGQNIGEIKQLKTELIRYNTNSSKTPTRLSNQAQQYIFFTYEKLSLLDKKTIFKSLCSRVIKKQEKLEKKDAHKLNINKLKDLHSIPIEDLLIAFNKSCIKDTINALNQTLKQFKTVKEQKIFSRHQNRVKQSLKHPLTHSIFQVRKLSRSSEDTKSTLIDYLNELSPLFKLSQQRSESPTQLMLPNKQIEESLAKLLTQ